MSNHGKTEDVPKHEFLLIKHKNQQDWTHEKQESWRSWNTVWSLKKLKMFPQKHDSYLSWRNSCKILKVPYPSSRKKESFSLFSPKFSCHKKRRIYWEGFFLSLLWSSFSGLHLFRLTALSGKARHEIHIHTAWGSLFFCLFRPLSLSYFLPWGIIDMFLCTLSFHFSRHPWLRH